MQFCLKEKLVCESPAKDDKNAPPPHAHFNPSLPTFGVVIKLHAHNAPRFLAKLHGSSLTQLSQGISWALQALMPESEKVWRSVFMAAAIVTQSSWIIGKSK